MKKNQQTYPTRLIRFRQWSRKGYAMFASLGVCTTIGQLRKNVTECALRKQGAPEITPEAKNLSHEEKTDTDIPPEQTNMTWQFACLLPQTENRNCVAATNVLVAPYIVYNKEAVLPVRENSLFSFKLTHYDNRRNQETGVARHSHRPQTSGMAGKLLPKRRIV